MNEIHVDRNALVFAEAVTDLAVSVQAVWAALSDIAKWPEFTPGVTAAQLDGTLSPGSLIQWSVRGMNITSPITAVSPPHRLVWRGSETAIHSWDITAIENGCRLVNAESLGKPFPGKTVEESRDLITRFLSDWNDAIGQRALGNLS